jgi:RNA polymerase sigma-70 factor (ECF subfamily)
MAHLTLHQAVGLGDETDISRDPFDRLVAENQRRVARLVYRLLGWRADSGGADVDDIVQDVFLTAFKNLKSFRDESSEWTWLAAIAINRCRTLKRRRLLEFRWRLRFRGESARGEGAVEEACEVERDDTSERVRRAVAELPGKDREVIVLYYLEEWPVGRISEALGVKAGAIDVRMHRAREKLRRLLEEDVGATWVTKGNKR